MNLSAKLLAVAAFATLAISQTASAKQLLFNSFENDADIAAFASGAGKSNELLPSKNAHSGAQSLLLRADLSGAERADFRLPSNFTQGFLSLWFWNSVFDSTPDGGNNRVSFRLVGEMSGSDGKKTRLETILECNRQDRWVVWRDNFEHVATVRGHAGWTRLDFLLEGSGKDKSLAVFIDGLEAKRFQSPDATLGSLVVANAHVPCPVVIDDLLVDDDPAAFRPAALQAVSPAGSSGSAELLAGRKLPLVLSLDSRAAKAGKGVLTLELEDLQEKPVLKTDVDIDWSKVKDGKLAVEIPAPQASKHYWVFSSYRDEGAKPQEQRFLAGKIDVQYRADAKSLALRDSVACSGFWDWLPAKDDALDAPPSDWSSAKKVLRFWGYVDGVKNGWYRQLVDIPASWDGKRLSVDVERPCCKAKVFLNGVNCGELVWPGGEIDVSGKLKPGEKAELALLVSATAPYSVLTRGPLTAQRGQIGLGGPVSLLAKPSGPVIDSVLVDAKAKPPKLDLRFDVAGAKPGEKLFIAGSVSRAGKPLATFKTEVAKDGKAKLSVPCPGVELWDLGKPELYDLEASLFSEGFLGSKILDAMPPRRVGFRDVAFEGRLCKLNGNPVGFESPTPTIFYGDYGFASCMARCGMNYNCADHQAFFSAPKQWTPLLEDSLAVCDEAGVGESLAIVNANFINPLNQRCVSQGLSLLDDQEFWDGLKKHVEKSSKLYGASPSYLFQGVGVINELAVGTCNPFKMDGLWFKRFPENNVMAQGLLVAERVKTLLSANEPSRPLVLGDKTPGEFQEAPRITHYVGFMQMQELIESDEPWLKYGTKPYIMNEQAGPMLFHDWGMHARSGHGLRPGGYGDYLHIAERAAVTKGDAAFHRQPVDEQELTQFEARYDKLREKDPRGRTTSSGPYLGPGFAYVRDFEAPCLFRDIARERAKEQYLNWRAEGLLLHVPWDDARTTGILKSVQEAWAPVTGYLAGSPSVRTDKTHILRPGELWERRFLAMSSKRAPVDVECKWTASLEGRTLVSGAAKATVGPGGQASFPIKVAIPAGSPDAAGKLVAELYEDGKLIASDSKDFQVLAPRPAPAIASRIGLVDPEGDSAAALERAGVPFQRCYLSSDLSRYDIVIFGRRAFNYEDSILGSGKRLDLGALLASGKKLIVLEQDEKALRERFNFRTETEFARMAYGRVAGHPALAGLPDSALSFWRGSATLVDGFKAAREQSAEPNNSVTLVCNTLWNDGKEHPRQLKWGTTHNVASVIIEKPARGNFRTLIDCEFALDYALLLEVEQGPGRLLFCQADVSGRSAEEPAAERLLSNIVSYFDGAKAPGWSSGVAYVGDAKGERLLSSLNATFRKIESPSELKPGEVLLLGSGLDEAKLASFKQSIASFVEKGGVCVSLPREKSELGWLPFELSAKDAAVAATAVDKPSRPLLAGVSNSELYWQTRLSLPVLDKLPQGSFKVDTGVIGEVPFGKGRYVFCQVAPWFFDVGKRFYVEDSMRRDFRLWQSLLNNLGVPMTPPAGLLPLKAAPKAVVEPPLDLETAASWTGFKTPLSDTVIPGSVDPRWLPLKVPGYIDEQRKDWDDKGSFLFWCRGVFKLDKAPELKAPAVLFIGAVDDEDDVYFNGTKIGHTGRDTNVDSYLYIPRYYKVPANLVKQGENEILVRVLNFEGRCGISSGPVKLVWPPLPVKPSVSDVEMELAKAPPVSLEGYWFKFEEPLSDSEAIPKPSDSRWSKNGVYMPRMTTAEEGKTVWLRSSVNISSIPAGAKPVFVIGSVDDEDAVFVNGVKIGRTGKDTNPKNYWEAPRAYPIPPGVLKNGANEIVIKTNNLPPGPGFINAPFLISWLPPEDVSRLRLSVSPYIFEVDHWNDPYWWWGGW